MSKYKTTHPSPNEIDRLRFKAFSTNRQEDVTAYYKAASLYFQARDVREMNRADHIEELEAKLTNQTHMIAQVFALLDVTEETEDGRVFHPTQIRSSRVLDAEKLGALLAELKGQDDE